MSPGHDLCHLDMTELCCTHRFALCYIHVTGAMFNQTICYKLFSYLFPMTADSVLLFVLVLEIPIFHVLNARITFGNIFALNQPVENVTYVGEDDNMTCAINESCFEAPPSYGRLGKQLVT